MLREGAEDTLVVPEPVSTLCELIELLEGRIPSLRAHLKERLLNFAVNDEMLLGNAGKRRLAGGDTVEVVPTISAGSDARGLGFALWLVAALAALAHVVIFGVLIIRAPAATQVTYTPDDGYYYLSLARHFAQIHRWTFDGDVSRTSGFHPGLAYLLAGAYRVLQPSSDGFVRVALAITSLLTILAACLVFYRGWKRRQAGVLAALAILLSTRNVLVNSVSVVEWPLVVTVIVLFCVGLSSTENRRSTLGAIFALGVLGSFSRSDFGLLPAAFFVAALVVRPARGRAAPLLAAGAGLAGAAAGVALLLVHNYLLTGLAMQSSALMKREWASGAPTIVMTARTIAAGVTVAALVLVRRRSGPIAGILDAFSATEVWFATTAVLALAGYTMFYSAMSGVQPWYTANVVMPCFVLLVALWEVMGLLKSSRAPLLRNAAFLLLLAGVVAVTAWQTYPIGVAQGRWPHQASMLRAGLYLRDNPLPGRVAGWNVGIVNYYAGGGVINLDGVVNNDIHRFASRNRLADYIHEKRVKYLIDFPAMFDRDAPRRGGYDDPRFLSSLQPIRVFDRGEYPRWTYLTLYRLVDADP